MAQRFLSNIKVNDAYTLPASDGTNGQIISTDGAGTLTFADAAASDAVEITVKNVSGGSLTVGTVITPSPSANPPAGNVLEVIAADNSAASTMPAIGVLKATLADDAEGSAIAFGHASGFDTSSFTAGDSVYVNTSGGFTTTKPTGTKFIQKIGIVIKSHASNGSIKVFGANRTNDVPTPLYIDHTNQRLGIGTTTPGYKLEVDGSAAVNSLTIDGTDVTASAAEINILDGIPSTLTATELGYVDGVTSAIQTQLDAKQATINGAASTIVSYNLTPSRVLLSSSSGKVQASNVTSTELSYLDGVTSSIQTQLDNKVSNVTTNLSTTANGTSLTINSSDGANASIPAATTSAWGAMTDEDKSKLDGIEASADVTDTDNVTAAGALMDSEVDADIKTLSLPANTTISTFGKSLIDDADAAAARATLGIDAAGTDNSTDVTLAGSLDYISIDGQVITRNAIDLSTDVTGTLPVGNMAATALTTVQTAANQTAHLALTTQEGDVVVRTDENKTYMHNGGTAGTMADFTLLATPTDAVTSVNGNTGAVTVTENVTTNLGITGTTGARTITSSDGTDAVIPVATDSVSGVMSAADHTKLSGIATNANNYTHPTFNGDDFSVDTGALTGATVVSDIDINVTTDGNGHVTDANGAVSTRTLTLGDLGYTGATNATANTGTVTSITVTPTAGLDGGGTVTTSGSMNISLDLSELTDMTADVVGSSDELILLDSGAERRKAINEIKLGQFNNDQGWTSNSGTVDTSGTPVDNDFAKFTDANTIEGRSVSETRSDLGLGNVTNESKSVMFTSPTFTGNVTIPANILHTGDTNTYFGFHGNDLFRVVTSGTERFEVSNSGIVINDGSNDYDFRVESNNNTHMLFVDGGNDRVGIGTTSPSYKLHVSGNSFIDPTSSGAALTLGRYSGQPTIKAHTDDGGYLLMDSTSNVLGLNWYTSQNIILANGGGKVGIKTVNPVVSLDINATDAIALPTGTTAQRPSSPAAGMFRYNTTEGEFEGYTTEWGSIGGGGGTVNVERNAYTGDGSDLTFNTTSTIDNENNVQVYVDGVYQSKANYSTSGNTVTFGSGNAPGNGAAVELIHHKGDTGAVIAADSIGTSQLVDNSVTHDKLSERYTDAISVSTLTGTVSFDCSNGSVFKLTGDITGNYTIDLTNYKKGQMITVYPIKGSYTVTLDAQGTTSNTFNKLAEADYDGASSNILQIECVDDSSTTPVFFYSVATYASDSTI